MAENMVIMMITAMLEELLSLSRPSYQRKGQAVEKNKQTESLYPTFCQRASKMDAHWKTERFEPIYK